MAKVDKSCQCPIAASRRMPRPVIERSVPVARGGYWLFRHRYETALHERLNLIDLPILP